MLLEIFIDWYGVLWTSDCECAIIIGPYKVIFFDSLNFNFESRQWIYYEFVIITCTKISTWWWKLDRIRVYATFAQYLDSIIKHDILLIFVFIVISNIFQSKIFNSFSFFINLDHISIWIAHFSKFRPNSLSLWPLNYLGTIFQIYRIRTSLLRIPKELLVSRIKLNCFLPIVSDLSRWSRILYGISIFKTNSFILFELSIMIQLRNVFLASLVVIACLWIVYLRVCILHFRGAMSGC